MLNDVSATDVKVIAGSATLTDVDAKGDVTVDAEGAVQADAVSAENIEITGNTVDGTDIVADSLTINAEDRIGSEEKPLGTEVNKFTGIAPNEIHIDNNGDLVIDSVVSAKDVSIKADSVDSNGTNIICDNLELQVKTDIGSEENPFLANVNSFAGTSDEGSIYLKNDKDLTLGNVTAKDTVNVTVDGNLVSDKNTLVEADKLELTTTGNADLSTKVNNLEGTVSGNLVVNNASDLTIGGVKDGQNGLTVDGNVTVAADGSLTVSETLSGKDVNLSATDSIKVEKDASVSADKLTVEVTGDPKSSDVTIEGDVNADETDVLGSETVTITVTDTMGDVTIDCAEIGSNIAIKVESLGGNLVINGSDKTEKVQINLADATKLDGAITINGAGADNSYDLSLGNSRKNADITVNGAANLNVTVGNANDTYSFEANGVTITTDGKSDSLKVTESVKLTITDEGGNNTFNFIDTPCEITLHSGKGDDTFLIGVPGVDNDKSITTAEGKVSCGPSYALTVNDQGGNNHWSIYSTKAPITLNGGNGDDTFYVKNLVEVDGSKLHAYELPEITINAGEGKDTLEVVKSGWFDKYEQSQSGLSGSGLNLKLNGIETVTVTKHTAGDMEHAMTNWQLVKYGASQLWDRNIIQIALASIVGVSALTGFALKKRRKAKKA